MNVTHLRRVRQMFNVAGVPRSTCRHNQRAWVRSVRLLGNQWLLATTLRRGHALQANAQR